MRLREEPTPGQDAISTNLRITPHKVNPLPEIAWSRTHMLIVNGDTEPRHKSNSRIAAQAALENNAASVHVCGVADTELDGVEYSRTSSLESAIMQIGKNSKKGDTVFLYITGHGAEEGFQSENSNKPITYDALINLLENNLEGRKIIFVSDACHSAVFVNKLSESGAFSKVVAMSPGVHEAETCCNSFAEPFWHAIKTGLDLDNNQVATLEEAFYYALEKYRKIEPNSMGTYRETIDRITNLSEAKNGVVIVSTEGCVPCKETYPALNTLNLMLRGTVNFYIIDGENVPDIKGFPTLIVMKDGAEVSRETGAKDVKELSGWLSSNGIDVGEFNLSFDELYEEGDYSSIALVFSYEQIKEKLGPDGAIDLVLPFLNHSDPALKKAALSIAIDALDDAGLKRSRTIKKAIMELLYDEDVGVQRTAAYGLNMIVFRKGYRATSEELAGLLKFCGEGGGFEVGPMSSVSVDRIMEQHPFMFELMISRLSRHDDPEIRKLVAPAIYSYWERIRFNEPEKLPDSLPLFSKRIIARLLDDENLAVKESALNAISNISIMMDTTKSDSLIEGVMNSARVKEGDNYPLQSIASIALGYIVARNPGKMVPYLEKFLNHPDPVLRETASEALSLETRLRVNMRGKIRE